MQQVFLLLLPAGSAGKQPQGEEGMAVPFPSTKFPCSAQHMQKNLFNHGASWHPSTEFLHLYKCGGLKLSYEPNFPSLCWLQTNFPWRSQPFTHRALSAPDSTGRRDARGRQPTQRMYFTSYLFACSPPNRFSVCEFWPSPSPSLTGELAEKPPV